ncbi:MAG TPA: 4Fe-4S ferredoxin, partial [Treponema sp.]|nr:4Fe-4S ferredoxin [Treponema sp.]
TNMENIVFYFSGTGNCLKAAKSVIKELGGGEIVSMAKPGKYDLVKQYDTIGFIYPTYFWGAPRKVIEFVNNLNVGNNKNTYFYIIATCGGYSAGAIYTLYKLLFNKHGVKVNYTKELKMFSNYVVLYDMNKKVHEITEKSDKKLAAIIDSIKKRENNKIGILHKIFGSFKMQRELSNIDKNYNVNDNCTGCGICRDVCPVKNIEMVNGKPHFKNKCEHCIACIQFCPPKSDQL